MRDNNYYVLFQDRHFKTTMLVSFLTNKINERESRSLCYCFFLFMLRIYLIEVVWSKLLSFTVNWGNFFFFPVGMLSTSYKVMFMFWLVFHFRDYLKIYMT